MSHTLSLRATGIVLLLLSHSAVAWDTELRIGVGATYSDNINQAPRGEQESELVLQLIPGISVSRSGGQLSLNLNYSAQGALYTDDSDRNTVFHRLGSRANAELLDDLLFVDADANYSQRLLTSRPDLGADPLGRRGDFSDVLTYRISPYLTPRWGEYLSSEIRYEYRAVDYRDDSSLDSRSDRFAYRIDSGTATPRLSWAVRYDRDDINFDDDSTARFESYSGLLSVNITEQVSVFGELGRDRNRFARVGETSRPSGTLWRTGVTWTPSTRTRVEGFYADRYFGSFFGGSLRHRFRHSTWAFDYQEEPTNIARLETRLGEPPMFDDLQPPVLDDDGNPIITDQEFPELTTELFVRRRGTLAVQGQRSKVGWRVRAFQERREFEFSQRDEEVLGAGVGFNYRLAPRTRLTFDYDQLRTDNQAQPDRERSHRARLGMQYTVGPRTSLSTNYQFVKSDGIEGVREPYEENRVNLLLTKRF